MSDHRVACIANLALDTFASLPAKCRPRTQADGSREWTPLSAVALSRPASLTTSSIHPAQQLHNTEVKLVSLATGTKSLPVSALPKCKGLVVHDCHAEILVLRGLNYWLLTEIERLVHSTEYDSPWLEMTSSVGNGSTSSTPFRLIQGVEISLFSTEAPCGDASMELLMAAAEAAGHDISPWPTDADQRGASDVKIKNLPLGRGSFSNLGALRRKPARADAEISMSKSCTDKLMLKQFTGLLSFPLDLLVEQSPEAFLKTAVVYEDQYFQEGYDRAFGPLGRLRCVLAAGEISLCTSAEFFNICTLPSGFRRFEFEKQRGAQEKVRKNKASNIVALWVAGRDGLVDDAVVEVLANGVKQGFRQFDERDRKGSVTCRRNMVRKAAELQRRLGSRGIVLPDLNGGSSCSYLKLKSSRSRKHRNDVKQFVLDRLGGWPWEYLKDDFEMGLSSPPKQ